MYNIPPPPPGPADDDNLTTDQDSNISPTGTSSGEVTEDLSRSGQADLVPNLTDESGSANEAFIALSKKHEEILMQNEKLKSLLDAERTRVTQLENQLALG